MKIKVGIVFGGKSKEHEVSLMSTSSVLEAIDRKKYEIILFYINKKGKWVIYSGPENNIETLDIDIEGRNISREVIDELYKLDVVLPLIHGPFGEDGSLQGFLEYLDITFVGSKVLGSAICMDKITSKKISKQAGIRCVDFYDVYKNTVDLDDISNWIDKYPVFVKPSNMGSSVGISKVENFNELENAIKLALKYDDRVLVEEGIFAREIECAVIEYEGIVVSGVGEVVATEDFYDYDKKYLDDGNDKMKIPAENLSDEIINEIREVSKKVFLAHDCKGLARVDFFVEKNTERVILNEINTIPGMTKFSMFPSLFGNIGIDYKELLDKMIENELKN